MLTFPQRDIDLHLLSTGGPIPEQSNGQAAKTERKRKPWVYKSEYDKLKKECDRWRRAFKASMWIVGILVAHVFGDYIIDLILSV